VRDIDWTTVLAADDGYRLREPAEASAISAAESTLQVSLTVDLRDLYLASDGLFEEPSQWFVIWPLADVVSRNQEAWAIEGGRRVQLVGFGDDGTGNPFCVQRDAGPEVFAWSPIDHDATHIAKDLKTFWRHWTAGTLPSH